MESDLPPLETRQALAGDAVAVHRLVEKLTPVIQARVARTLLLRRVGGSSGRDVRQEIDDVAQEIFLLLFSDGGRLLRTWQPERGLSLANFVGLVAERQTVSILRNGKRSPWKEDPTLLEDLDRETEHGRPEVDAASRETLRLLLGHLREELSPLGRHLFNLLFLREMSLTEVTASTGLSADAVYAWRSRLRKQARGFLLRLSESGPTRRKPLRDS
jgi:RNA polymerase sigma-70 factor (ECF subfamily)